MRIKIANNKKELSHLAAEEIKRQIKVKNNSALGLPTGNTPVEMYKNLVKAFKKGEISFKKASTFNLDEYQGLGPKDKGSYHYYMRNRFFKHIDIDPANVFIFNGQAGDHQQECLQYEKEIKKRGGLDLTILGIGMDGHIAFNEPGSLFNSRSRLVTLAPESRKIQAKNFPNGRPVPRRAFTAGIATIMKSRKIILLASGKKKAGIVAQTLKGKITKSVPASILQRHPNCLVILDKQAASLI